MGYPGKLTLYRLEISQSPAFLALNIYAKALYPQLCLEWRPAPFNKNGNIRYSVSQAAKFLGCTEVTAGKALADLQRKGLIRVTEIARLAANGMA